MKIKFIVFLFIAILFSGFTAKGQSWLWGTEGTIPTQDYDAWGAGTGVTSDAAGNSYITGWFDDTIQIGKYSLIFPYFSEDGLGCTFVAKYDSNKNVVWAHQSNKSHYNSTSSGGSVATDGKGSVYVYGTYWDSISFASISLPYQTQGAIFLVKYDVNGNVIWAISSVAPNSSPFDQDNSSSGSVTIDKSGNLYIDGTFTDTVSFGAISLVSNKYGCIFYAKYDPNGNVLWAKQPSNFNVSDDIPGSIAIDKFNNIYMPGIFGDTLTFGTTSLINPQNQSPQAFIAKFDSNGNNLWARQAVAGSLTSKASSGAGSLAFDKSDNFYMTGSFNDTIDFESYKLISRYSDIFLVKYDINGNVLWAQSPVIPENYTTGWSVSRVATDTDNNVYVVGGTETCVGNVIFGKDTINIDSVTETGASILVKLDTSGKTLCGVGIYGSGLGNDIAVGLTGKYVYFGGSIENTISFGPDFLPYEDGQVPFMAKWRPCFACNSPISINTQSQSVCSGQSVLLKATAISGTTYAWSPQSALSSTTGDSIIANPTISTTYTVIGTDLVGCTGSASDSITTIPAPNKPIIIVSVTGDSLISSANSYNQWYFNDSLLNDTTPVLVIKGHPKGWYKVVVTNPANGCSTTSDSTTSIYQLSVINNQLSIYPNPFDNQIVIKINPSVIDVNNWSLKLYDVLGRTLYSKASLSFNNEIDLGDLPSGMYFISVSNGAERAVFPVVKQN